MGLLGLASSLPKGFGLFSLRDKNSWISTLYDNYIQFLVGIAVDSNGVIYTAGRTEDATYSVNLFLAKYDNAGTVQWQKKETTAQVEALNCSINGTTEVYVGGNYTVSGSRRDLVTIKFNDSGTLQWQRRLGTDGYKFQGAVGTCVDSAGNIIITSSVTNDAVYEGKGFIAKYNSSGTLQWQRDIANGVDVYYLSPARDSSDNVYAPGYFTADSSNYTNYQCLLVKYNSSGTLQWQRELGNASADQGIYSTVVDSAGDVYAVATSNHNRTYYSIRVVKYNSSGTLQWQRELYSGSVNLNALEIAIDSSDNIYLSGYDNSTPSFIILAKYNSSGTIQWQRSISSSGLTRGYELQIVGSNIYLCGIIDVSGTGAGQYDTLVFKLPTDGSKTGTYSLNGFNYTYAASSYTETASSLTSATSTLTGSTTTYTDQSLSMTLSTTTLTDAIVKF